MPKTFDDYAAQRDAELTPAGATAVRVFDAAYAMGAALAGARRARHLKQAELAALAGVTQADISRIERGQMAPTTPTLLKLVSAMHGRVQLVVPALPDRDADAAEHPAFEDLVTLSLV